MDEVYVVCGHSGSYSDYSMIVVKVFACEEKAKTHRQFLEDTSAFRQKIYNEFQRIPFERPTDVPWPQEPRLSEQEKKALKKLDKAQRKIAKLDWDQKLKEWENSPEIVAQKEKCRRSAETITESFNKHQESEKIRLLEFVQNYPDVPDQIRNMIIEWIKSPEFNGLYYSDESYTVETTPFE